MVLIVAFLLWFFPQDDVNLTILNTPNQNLEELDKEIRAYRSNSDFISLAKAYYQRALIYKTLPLKRKEVIEDLTSSAKYFKVEKNEAGFHMARLELANFYTSEGLFYNDARRLSEEALAFYKENKIDFLEIEAATALGRVLLAQYEFEAGLDVVSSALDKSLLRQNKSQEIQNRLLLSQLLGSMGKVEEAVQMAGTVVKLEKKLEQIKYSAEALMDMGYYYYRDANYDLAISKLKEAELIPDLPYKIEIKISEILSKCFEERGKDQQALYYLKKADALKEAQRDSEKFAISNQLALEYQAQEKEKAIENLETENEEGLAKLQQSRRLLIALGALLLVGILAVYYIIRYYNQRNKTRTLITQQREELDRQRIMKLQNDLRIQSLEAMMNGQELERSRIANDLHDSLGGLLSTLKLQYDSLQLDHKKLTADQSYQKIYELIDHACGEVRDISRNLKPASLEKIGLSAALNDLINRYSANGNPEIFLHTNRVDTGLSNEKKLHVYRIIQELLNNAIKHSEATELDIQLSQQNKELFVKVEDNGKGFNEEKVKKGLGLENIKSRVNMLKGELEWDSSPDRGTSVMIHIPVMR